MESGRSKYKGRGKYRDKQVGLEDMEEVAVEVRRLEHG